MSPTLLWFLLAAFFLVGEVLTTGFFLGALAVAALAAVVAAALGAGLWLQVLVFAVGAVLVSVLARPLALRYLYSRRGGVATNVNALVGSEARVVEGIDPVTSQGRVLVRGDNWRALSADGEAIAPGSQVLVVEVDGTTLHVVRQL
ncbi:MAG TPA: NfeD family protein [Longimicrobiaceae bacterium]|nr:NfeD family protein [Longimicrobiaceae bacterium]